jgi:PEGA domain
VRNKPAVMVSTLRVLLLCVPLLLSTACATVFHGRTQETTVASEPVGAQVFIGNELVGVTPARIILKRRESHLVLRFEKEGYQPGEVALKRSFSGWIAGDIGLGAAQFANQGIVSQSRRTSAAAGVTALTLGVDLLTGSAYELPTQVQVTLRRIRP